MPYSEVQDNLLDESMLPLNLLRFKLAFFGASKFDPKSELWTRICMYQGAPMPEHLSDSGMMTGTFQLYQEGLFR
jgi:hypothetical protein